MKTILVVDDNKAIQTAARMLLEPHFKNLIALSSPNRILHTLREEKVDIVLLT
jgi:CheY-like chemotaxis protein